MVYALVGPKLSLVDCRKCMDEEVMGVHQDGPWRRALVVCIWNGAVKAVQSVQWVDDGRVGLGGSLDVGCSIGGGSETRS